MHRWTSLCLALLLTGCAVEVPFAASSIEREAFALKLVECHRKYHEIVQQVSLVLDTEKCAPDAKACAFPHGKAIWLDPINLEVDDVSLEMIIAHEMCHISGIWGEDQADFCAQLAYRDAGCEGKIDDE